MQYLEDINNITLYQLVQYVNSTYDTRIEHNKVMTRQMPEILTYPEFGASTQIVEKLYRNNALFEITTYKLNPQQCVVVAAKICPKYLMHVVDKLMALEVSVYGEIKTIIPAVTVYQLVNLLNNRYDTQIRHNDVMSRQLPKLLEASAFGVVDYVEVEVTRNNAPFKIRTAKLNPRQALVVAGKISIPYLINIVRKLHILETVTGIPTSADELAMAVLAWRRYYNDGITKGIKVWMVDSNVVEFNYRENHHILINANGKEPDWSNVCIITE